MTTNRLIASYHDHRSIISSTFIKLKIWICLAEFLIGVRAGINAAGMETNVSDMN